MDLCFIQIAILLTDATKTSLDVDFTISDIGHSLCCSRICFQ